MSPRLVMAVLVVRASESCDRRCRSDVEQPVGPGLRHAAHFRNGGDSPATSREPPASEAARPAASDVHAAVPTDGHEAAIAKGRVAVAVVGVERASGGEKDEECSEGHL